jgi:recombinational DNA repair ATPase RecF
MADYWEKQLKEISTLVDEARADFMTSWEAALQAAADAFKSSVEEITNAFEKSMAGTFGTFAEMQKQYD